MKSSPSGSESVPSLREGLGHAGSSVWAGCALTAPRRRGYMAVDQRDSEVLCCRPLCVLGLRSPVCRVKVADLKGKCERELEILSALRLPGFLWRGAGVGLLPTVAFVGATRIDLVAKCWKVSTET